MTTSNLMASIVRRARRIPGYRRLRRSALRRLRASTTTREVVSRVFAGSKQGERALPQRFPEAGNMLAGVGVDAIPVMLINLTGVPAQNLDYVVQDIARYQVLYASFRPVFLLDQPEFAVTRRFNYPTEMVIQPDQWDFPDQPWAEYFTQRLAQIIRVYRVSMFAQIPPDGVDDAMRMVLATAQAYSR